MGGGLMQLVAYGSQDVYLTGNPQITFWKVVYRRHTNFALEAVRQDFNGTAKAHGNVVATISRNGDLIHKAYLVVQTNGASTCVADLIKTVELEIGGQQIDKHYGEWMDVWNDLSCPTGKKNGWDQMVKVGNGGTAYIPLEFFFCTNPGLALPLIALQYHEVRIKFTLGGMVEENGASLWVDYVYLDTDERRRMAQSSHEFLITQLQQQEETSSNARLNFNHPVKELVWKNHTLDSNGDPDKPDSIKLTLNGHDRMAPRDWKYFNKVQPYQHHTNIPSDSTIGVYSFALKPEDSQPSGSCNFSRIDNAQLSVSNANDLTIWATNWNVLRIMSGMGGLAYSN